MTSTETQPQPPRTFIYSPWEAEFLEHCHAVRHIIRFACPFVKLRNIRLILASLSPMIDRPLTVEFLTRLNADDCRNGVLDVAAIQLLSSNPLPERCDVVVRFDNTLHAKLYLFDDRLAIVSSSNLTYSGFHRNLEVALISRDSSAVGAATSYFQSIFSAATAVSPQLIDDITDAIAAAPSPRLPRAAPSRAPSHVHSITSDEPITPPPITVDPNVVVELDRIADEILTHEVTRQATVLQIDLDRPVGTPAALPAFLEQAASRLRAVIGDPVPSEADLLVIFAHSSTYPILPLDTQYGVLADRMCELGTAAFSAALAQLLIQRRPSVSAHGLRTTLDFVLTSDFLQGQLAKRCLMHLLVSPSVVGADDPIGKAALSRIARMAGRRLCGYLFSSRSWSMFVDLLDALLPIDDEFPFESYADHIYKSILQRELQSKGLESPKYLVITEHGPRHNSEFSVEVKLHDQTIGRGVGRRKRVAETLAAFDALRAVGTGGISKAASRGAVSLPAQIKLMSDTDGPAVIRQMCGRTLASFSPAEVLIPSSAYGTSERMMVLRLLGAEIRELGAVVAASAVPRADAALSRVVSAVNKVTSIAANLTDTPLNSWLRRLARISGFENTTVDRNLVETADAILGAVTLEHGFEGCATLLRLMLGDISRVALHQLLTAKSRLQQVIQGQGGPHAWASTQIVYRSLHKPTQAHNPKFLAVVMIDGVEYGRGEGGSKQAAAEVAAEVTLRDPRLTDAVIALRPKA